MYAIRSYYAPLGNMLILDEQTGHPVIASRGGEKIFQMASGSAPEDPELEKKYLIEDRITSYNVCYTKLLRAS